MIVALAASTAFMTPVSSPVNMLVVKPGDYAFGDFVRIGAPFSVIVLVVSVLLVPWLLPLRQEPPDVRTRGSTQAVSSSLQTSVVVRGTHVGAA
jgi:Na+/H+ antiporter NhaD/arsenite permease-like protein